MDVESTGPFFLIFDKPMKVFGMSESEIMYKTTSARVFNILKRCKFVFSSFVTVRINLRHLWKDFFLL